MFTTIADTIREMEEAEALSAQGNPVAALELLLGTQTPHIIHERHENTV
jgi:hypothetical protein